MPIALLTDFGTRDPYVAAMKGVLASRTAAPIFDLTHEIAVFDVLGAAWFLNTVMAYWPEGTIFVCVVDPGVGSARRIVAMEREGRVFLAPDNGLLTFVRSAGVPPAGPAASRRRPDESGRRDGAHPAGEDAGVPLFSVENSALFLPNGSNTFHGRDRFAPVAAALANGLPITEVGPRIDDIVLFEYEAPLYSEELVRGTVVAIDRFGNAITDIEAARVPFALRLEQNYADAAPGAFLIVGSTGHIEISIANGNAAEELRMKRLQRVELTPL
jgi:S-adenosylmethionine hydrolase